MKSTACAFPHVPGTDEDSLANLIAAANSVAPGFINCVIDGGAGIGDTLNPLLAIPSSSLKIIAYEPLPENAKVLRQRFAGVPKVEVREAAIGDRLDFAQFVVPSRIHGAPGRWSEGTSYSGYLRKGYIAAARLFLGNMLRRMKSRETKQTVQIKVVRLDADLQTVPDVVKLDL